MISYLNTFDCLLYTLQVLTELGQKGDEARTGTQIEMQKNRKGIALAHMERLQHSRISAYLIYTVEQGVRVNAQ